jgi:hypothetical protein
MNIIFTLLLALILAAFPLVHLSAPTGQSKENPSLSIKDLRNAATEVVLDGRSLSLSAYPWRDFMPGTSTADGSPMMVGLRVATSDKKPFPSGVRADGAWILFGEQMWEISDLRRNVAGIPDNKDSSEKWINCPVSPVCEFTVRDGPKWGPGVFVDVVVRLTDKEGRHHLLQVPKQYVKAAW